MTHLSPPEGPSIVYPCGQFLSPPLGVPYRLLLKKQSFISYVGIEVWFGCACSRADVAQGRNLCGVVSRIDIQWDSI